MKVAPTRPPGDKGKDKKDEDKDDDDGFQDAEKEVGYIFGGPDAYDSKRKQKLAYREVNAIVPAMPEYLHWSDVPIALNRSDHPDYIPRPGRYPLVLAPTVNKVKLKKTFVDGGNCLDLLFIKILPELGLTVKGLDPRSSPFHGIIPGCNSYPLG